ncbi:MAG: hypothetical protein JWM68_3767 [Verrucomicrobiales bacterium]|nr:hypothetical protein [Verrucomicrobiales bacterium]
MEAPKIDFVFIDGTGKPFRVMEMSTGKIWLCRWHEGQKGWVTNREVEEQEVFTFLALAIPVEDALVYHRIAARNSIASKINLFGGNPHLN